MERPDADLVAAARLGERDAFAELITRHRPTTLAVIARLLGSQELAGDAVQEATVVAMTALDQLRSADRFGAWLCGIALNVARRWLRELRTVPLTSRIADMATAGGPDEQLEAAELALAVRRAVAGLADGQREAVCCSTYKDSPTARWPQISRSRSVQSRLACTRPEPPSHPN